MTTPQPDMAERYERARGLFEHGEYQAAADGPRLARRRQRDGAAAARDDRAAPAPRPRLLPLGASSGRAERVTLAILADHPDEPYANLLLGRTLQRQGRHDEAKPHLAMAELLGGYGGSGRLSGDDEVDRLGDRG